MDKSIQDLGINLDPTLISFHCSSPRT